MPTALKTTSIYRIDYELIINIKKFRKDQGWSQRELSQKMGFVETFVGKCESLEQPEKYNLRHLGILKKIFDFKSLDDFFPHGIPKDEKIVVHYIKKPKIKSNGTLSKILENEVIKIEKVNC